MRISATGWLLGDVVHECIECGLGTLFTEFDGIVNNLIDALDDSLKLCLVEEASFLHVRFEMFDAVLLPVFGDFILEAVELGV